MKKVWFAVGIVFLLHVSSVTTMVVGVDINPTQTEKKVTIYYADALVEYTKYKTGSFIVTNKDVHFFSGDAIYNFKANLDNLTLEVVMNYTAVMNFTAGFPYIFLAPIVAFGMKIENYSDYVWQSFKLKHNGYARQEGNISIPIHFDMNNIKPGGRFLLKPIIAIVGDPMVFLSKDSQFLKYTSFLLRFIYSISLFNRSFLNKWILPFIAEHNEAGTYGEFTKIYILFE
jgi:hypothetical protein